MQITSENLDVTLYLITKERWLIYPLQKPRTASTRTSLIVKALKKEFLPKKICVVCLRPFTWRKKWEKVWEEVKYCSDKCRMNKNQHG